MKVILNGDEYELPGDATVQALVERLKLAGQPVAVEVNKTLVPRRKHAEATLAEGDRVEVVTLVGGG